MNPLTKDNTRLLDLVRQMRGHLHTDGLITDDEYADLAMIGSASARRLEDYDDLRAQLADWQQKHSGLKARLARCLVALNPFAELLGQYDLGEVGGGTLVSPNIKVQMVKDARAALAAHGRDAGGPGEQGEK